MATLNRQSTAARCACVFGAILLGCAAQPQQQLPLPDADAASNIPDADLNIGDVAAVADVFEQADALFGPDEPDAADQPQDVPSKIVDIFDFDSINWAQPGCEPSTDATPVAPPNPPVFISGPTCLPAIPDSQPVACPPNAVCQVIPWPTKLFPSGIHRFDDGSFWISGDVHFFGQTDDWGWWRMSADGAAMVRLSDQFSAWTMARDRSRGGIHSTSWPHADAIGWRLSRWNRFGQWLSDVVLEGTAGVQMSCATLSEDGTFFGRIYAEDYRIKSSTAAWNSTGKLLWQVTYNGDYQQCPIGATASGYVADEDQMPVPNNSALDINHLTWHASNGKEIFKLPGGFGPWVFDPDGGAFGQVSADHINACGQRDSFDTRIYIAGGLNGPPEGLIANQSGYVGHVTGTFSTAVGSASIHGKIGSEEPSCLYIDIQSTDGRRQEITPSSVTGCLTYHHYPLPNATAEALPNGGFAIATPDALYITNANGSASCPGCGPPAPDCSDKDPCTKDECDPKLGDCVHLPIAGCSKAKGTCFNTADCDDGEPCTADTCDVTTGACSHATQATCATANDCFNFGKWAEIAGTCVEGTCVPKPNANLAAFPIGLKNEGWITRQLSQRPQVFEGKNTDTLVVGGWEAQRIQPNGVLRWQRDLDGAAAAAALTPDDGLVIAITQLHGKVQPGKTRIVRMAPTGQTLQDTIIPTGLDDWTLYQPWLERKRWLLPKPGGYILVGTKAWTADAWQGRIVQLTDGLTPTSAVDVSLPGFGVGEVPKDRAVEQFWPLPDGGVLVGWRLSDKSGLPRWGAARIAANGQVLWDKQLATGDEGVGGFDRWRPQGFVAQGGKTFVVRILPGGPGVPQITDAASFGKLGAIGQNPANLYAELPGQRTVTIIEVSDAFQSSATWPTLLPGYNNPGFVLHAFLDSQKQVISDVYVRSDKRVQLLISGGPNVTYNALITLDEHGLWPPCAKLEPPMDWTKPPFDDPLKCKGGYWPYYCVVPK